MAKRRKVKNTRRNILLFFLVILVAFLISYVNKKVDEINMRDKSPSYYYPHDLERDEYLKKQGEEVE
jgi:lipopolysaccharide export system protein LptC